MYNTFHRALAFNQPLTTWDTSKVRIVSVFLCRVLSPMETILISISYPICLDDGHVLRRMDMEWTIVDHPFQSTTVTLQRFEG